MAEEKDKKAPKARKVAKEAELPKPAEIRKARKAELQELCRTLDLDDGGTVPVLRERLLDHVAESEEVRIIEEEAAKRVRPRPELNDETRRLLAVRREIAGRRPEARRQEWFRYRKLGDSWRRPKGTHSKQREGYAYRTGKPNIGRRGPRAVRHLHPSGFREVLVHRVEDLADLDPAKQAARIAHGVGFKKRLEIQDTADKRGIRVLNPG